MLVGDQKARLRTRMRSELAALDEAERRTRSRIIQDRVLALEEFQRAGTIMCYVSVDTEVETCALIERAFALGKRVAVPLVEPATHRLRLSLIQDLTDDLTEGAYGVPEPKASRVRLIPPTSLDLAIVPGLAFHPDGHRLGRGEGYFDRFLGELPPQIPRIGLAFSLQIIDELPRRPHDLPVTRVVTDH